MLPIGYICADCHKGLTEEDAWIMELPDGRKYESFFIVYELGRQAPRYLCKECLDKVLERHKANEEVVKSFELLKEHFDKHSVPNHTFTLPDQGSERGYYGHAFDGGTGLPGLREGPAGYDWRKPGASIRRAGEGPFGDPEGCGHRADGGRSY